MEKLIPILILGLFATVVAIFLKESKMPMLAVLVSLTAGIIIFIKILPSIGQVIDVFSQLAAKANLNTLYLNIILKIIAISYVAEFVGQICKDAGQGGIAIKIDVASKVLVMVMAVPVLVTILDSVVKILP